MPETVRPDFYERMIARHSLDSIIITGTDGITEWVNEAFTRMTGYQLDDMVGKKPGAVLQGSETETATIQAISDALRNRTPIRTEIRNIAKSLRPFWIDLLITPIFDDDGKHTHFMSIQRDITERKEREQVNEDILRREKHREAERSLVGQLSEWLYTAKSLDELLMVVRRGMETLIPEAEGALFFYAASRDTLDLAAYWGGAEALDRVKPDQCWALRRGRAYSFGTRAIEFTCDHVPARGVSLFLPADRGPWRNHRASAPLLHRSRRHHRTPLGHRGVHASAMAPCPLLRRADQSCRGQCPAPAGVA